MPIHEDQNGQLILYPCSSPAAVAALTGRGADVKLQDRISWKKTSASVWITRTDVGADSKRQQPTKYVNGQMISVLSWSTLHEEGVGQQLYNGEPAL